MEEWDKLRKIDYITVETKDKSYDFLVGVGTLNHRKITKLLPDPDTLIRHHNGGDCPLPDHTVVRIYDDNNNGEQYLAHEIDWSGEILGYRIIGKANE